MQPINIVKQLLEIKFFLDDLKMEVYMESNISEVGVELLEELVSDRELEMAAEAQYGGLGTTTTKSGCTLTPGGC